MLLVSCARALPPGPYPLNFSIDVKTPRVLAASQEVAVPVIVANTGVRSWDAKSVHVSYHWLWLVPRETIKRSRWDLPYHDGIRSELTDRGELLGPGARVASQERTPVLATVTGTATSCDASRTRGVRTSIEKLRG